MLVTELLVIFLCLAAGGVLKGATGAGTPVLAVPALAMFFDVKTAVIILLLPNLMTNASQIWRYRSFLPKRSFLKLFLVGGTLGAGLGTWALTQLSAETLEVGVGIVVLVYIAFRLLHPHWKLSDRLGTAISLPAGVLAGILQGASGISAPVSITYLNAMRLERSVFIPSISALFLLFVAVQIPALVATGDMTAKLSLISAVAVAPVLLAMPLGSRLAKSVSPVVFDRIILTLLAILAIKLVWGGLL
ncbi:sulfite exporter TauE/SafE family protein [Breoghania sp.]|uniref:sulfite exporter TauE/SafE family protein n=1 Tax=Breoghania sp. TaxID=2065378 RepID=UPI0029C9B33E|nr:sulfite exporter TauE/SafE family protein [Breoghania sp.]